MWLDRFSQHSTPSASPPPGHSRNSPVPRRSSHFNRVPQPLRPGLDPRSSSLLSLTNLSTDSLPSTGRGGAPNGSALRQQVGTPPLADIADPFKVLSSILGKPVEAVDDDDSDIETAKPVARPEELATDIDFGELSLEEFAEAPQVGAQLKPTQGPVPVTPMIAEFEHQREHFEDLHRSITGCDEVLKSVETYLASFQKDLAVVSAEIESLQSRSTELNDMLENRKKVEKILSPQVEEVILPPSMVHKIVNGQVDDQYIRAIGELDKRKAAFDSKTGKSGLSKATEELKPLLENLQNIAVRKIRDHIVTHIKAIRNPNANAQIIQSEQFLRYKEMFPFVIKHHPQLATDVMQAYVNTMRWYFTANFTRYKTSLDTLKIQMIEKTSALGEDPAAKPAGLATPKVPSGPQDLFSLGRRIDILRSAISTAIPASVADEDTSVHNLEVPFRSFNLTVIDNASFEYTFLTEFFQGPGPNFSYHAISRKFIEIFTPTFELGQQLTKSLIETSFDAIGILVAVRLNQGLAFELQRRKVPAVDGYINATNMLLWPRFQQVIDAHCESVKKATAAVSGRAAGALTLTGSSSSSAASTAPHRLTQRFASFAHSVLSLSAEAGDDEPVGRSLTRLRTDYAAFITKVAKGLGDQRKRNRFLFNNYSLVLTVVSDITGGKLVEEFREHFEELKEAVEEKR